MANNEELYCNHCRKVTTFFLESDLIWYCDECDKPLHSYPILETDEIEEELQEFEEEYGLAVYCATCGNFVLIEDIDETQICPFCADDITPALEKHNLYYDEEKACIVENIEY